MNFKVCGAVLAAGLAAGGAALAGACPPDQVRLGARSAGDGPTRGVTAQNLGDIPLGQEIAGMDGRHLHMRKVVIAPGGVTAWHNHVNRPALTTVLSGVMTEYRADCAVPIPYPAGDVSREVGATYHYWRNNGPEPAVVLSTDIEGDAPAPAH